MSSKDSMSSTVSVGKRTLRLFIQEDQMDTIDGVLATTKLCLLKAGFQLDITTAGTADEATKTLCEKEFDLMLFDLFLPQDEFSSESATAGIGVIKEVLLGKNIECRNSIKPFILLSIHGKIPDDGIDTSESFQGFFNKSNPTKIANAIENIARGIRYLVSELDSGIYELCEHPGITARCDTNENCIAGLLTENVAITNTLRTLSIKTRPAHMWFRLKESMDQNILANELLLEDIYEKYLPFELKEFSNQYEFLCIHESGKLVSFGEVYSVRENRIECQVSNLLDFIDPDMEPKKGNAVLPAGYIAPFENSGVIVCVERTEGTNLIIR